MTKLLLALACVSACALVVSAQNQDPPVQDARLSVHTLVREDVFAGFLQNDTARLTRAEKNMDLLLSSRPADRASILAWQGSAALTRAVLAYEERRPDIFAQHYGRALDLFAEAMRLGPDAVGVFAVIGGGNVSVAERLPDRERRAAWEQGYRAYEQLWRLQSSSAAQLPLHHKGELLAGLAETAQRSGRVEVADEHLQRILTMMPETPYAARAQQWRDDPASRATTRLTCQTCHAPGTLAVRMAAVAK